MDEFESQRSNMYFEGGCFDFISNMIPSFVMPSICYLQDGDKFWRMPECYIRGSTIKYLRIPDEVIDMVKEDAQVIVETLLFYQLAK